MPRKPLAVLTAAWPSSRYPATGTFIRGLARALARRGERIAVVAPRLGRCEDAEVARFPSPVARLKLARLNPAAGILYLLAAARATLEASRAAGAEALLVHWVLPGGPAALLVARRLRIPLIVWAHGSDLEIYARRSRLLGLLARRVLAGAARVFAVSESLAARARALGARAVSVLPMGVAPHFKERPPAAPAARVDPFTAVYLGDLIPAKGVRTILRAASLLGPARPARFLFAGAGPLAREIERAGGTVVGPIASTAVADLLDRSHVLILPSRSEGTPLSVLEGLARGVPVLASRVGGIPEWVADGREGILLDAPPGPHAVARAVARLVDDRSLWERLAAGARRRGTEVPTEDDVAGRFQAELLSTLNPEPSALDAQLSTRNDGHGRTL